MVNQPPIIDTHVHLTDSAFDKDRTEILARAQRAGLVAFIDPGSDLASSQAAVKFAQEHQHVFAAVGLHPHALQAKDLTQTYKKLRKLTQGPKVVAIGEFGLDLEYEGADFERQKEAFKQHVAIAREQGLPIILHCRDLYDELIDLIKEQADGIPGVIHSFAGNSEQARELVKLGYYIALGGIVTFEKRTEELREAARQVPLDKMLLETDAPYLTPVPRRGKRNEPAEVATIGRFIAELRQIPYSELARQTTANAKKAFSLPAGILGV